MGDAHENTRHRFLAAMQTFAGECGERLRWPAARRAAVRDDLLRATLRRATDGSPWHRGRLAGLDVDQLSGDDLSALPVMTKSDLMANWDGIVTDEALSLDDAQQVLDAHAAGEPFRFLTDRYLVVATGGSTGERGVIVADEHAFASRLGADNAMGRAQVDAGVLTPPDTVERVVIAQLTATNPIHLSSANSAIIQGNEGREFHVVGPTVPVTQGVATLNEIQPHVLIGYPSLLELYAHVARAGRLRITPMSMTSYAEPLTREAKRAIEETWGVPVSNLYGASEGFQARSWGGSEALYQPDDVAVLELVDDDDQPVPPGTEASKVLLTQLHNRIQPLIRYEISDRVSWGEPPDGCPWEGQWLLAPSGRSDDVFQYGSDHHNVVTVHPNVFRSALLADANILAYQVHQTPAGAEVHVTSADSAPINEPALADRLIAGLKRAGLADPNVTVVVDERLERHPQSGKLRRFVPLGATV